MGVVLVVEDVGVVDLVGVVEVVLLVEEVEEEEGEEEEEESVFLANFFLHVSPEHWKVFSSIIIKIFLPVFFFHF